MNAESIVFDALSRKLGGMVGSFLRFLDGFSGGLLGMGADAGCAVIQEGTSSNGRYLKVFPLSTSMSNEASYTWAVTGATSTSKYFVVRFWDKIVYDLRPGKRVCCR